MVAQQDSQATEQQPKQITAGNYGSRPNRLSKVSRVTTEQAAFAKLIAQGLNSCASCYREAFGIKQVKGEWWSRQKAYELLQKPHVQALVSKLKAQYDSVRPALSRSTKREILRDMAIAEDLDAADRQRAIDLDNKMQSEYSERLHLTGDVNISMFRVGQAGSIPWQLAEEVIDLKPEPKQVLALESTDSDYIDSKAISSSPEPQPIPRPQPDTVQPLKRKGKGKLPTAKLTKEQQQALGKTYCNRRRKTKG